MQNACLSPGYKECPARSDYCQISNGNILRNWMLFKPTQEQQLARRYHGNLRRSSNNAQVKPVRGCSFLFVFPFTTDILLPLLKAPAPRPRYDFFILLSQFLNKWLHCTKRWSNHYYEYTLDSWTNMGVVMVRSLAQFTRQHDCIKFSANNISKARMNIQVFVGIMTHGGTTSCKAE